MDLLSNWLDAAPASFCLLAATILTSVAAFLSPELWRYLALEPYRMVRERQYHQIITSGFVHADLMHLMFNTITFFFFGPSLEAEHLGGQHFLIVYLVSLVVGSLYPLIKFRNDPDYRAIGASGAVSGIVFSYCLFNPLATFYVFFAIPMPAFLFAILYVIYSAYSMRRRQDNIGHEAHLAGAIAGLITTLLLSPDALESFRSHLP
jgi:membrane associated rhomboid family serine protease